MKSVIYTRIDRCPQELLDAIGVYSVADLHEALGAIEGRSRLMSSKMRPGAPGQRSVGRAVTSYNYPGDNLMIHAALNVAQRGDMIVNVNGGLAQGALWGDLAGLFAGKKGIAGAIIDGPTRDSGALRDMGFNVWSTAVSPSHPEKRGPGAVNMPVICDGVRVEPGDIIVADDDGVLVIPVALAAATIEKAHERAVTEGEIRVRLESGESLFEILKIQNYLEAAGIRTADMTWRDENQSAQ